MTDEQELKRLMTRSLLKELDASVGRRVQLHRQLSGFNVRQLAQLSGLREEKISAIEDGRHRAGTLSLLQIGRTLDVPVAHFFPTRDR